MILYTRHRKQIKINNYVEFSLPGMLRFYTFLGWLPIDPRIVSLLLVEPANGTDFLRVLCSI